MDGVLSDASGRQHLLERRAAGLGRLLRRRAARTRCIDEVARLLELLDPELRVVLLTARPISVQRHTLGWLDAPRAPLGPARDARVRATTARRPTSSRTPSATLRDVGFDLRLAFEDDRRNVDMFEGEGIPCLYIHSGYY